MIGPLAPDVLGWDAGQLRDAAVGEAEPLGLPQKIKIE
jgi:hypothetical protein